MKRWLIWAGLLIVALSVAACGGTSPAPTAAAVPAAANGGGNLVTTASGLKYEDLVVGTGASPAPTDKVTVHYTGTLQDGTVFDASRMHGGPISFPLNAVIKGWTEGVGSMKVGGTRKLVIPPDLGYGSQANGSIPANSTLTFIVELLDIPRQQNTPKVTIEDTQVGTGAEAVPGKTVSVYYTGKLVDGKVFDSNVGKDPLSFTVGAGQMIPGFDLGVQGMQVGGQRTITIPPSLGYGEQGVRGVVPPNATLIFEVELADVK
jgi:FKBP-type peptidyl-prolyl cis-trans isomerase